MKTQLFTQTKICVLNAPFAALLAVASLAFMPASFAGHGNARLNEWVEAQDGGTDGFLFVPPVPNFFGWSAPDSPYGLSVDFNGLAEKHCEAGAGTRHYGSVRERVLPDGGAKVTIKLITTRAITWAIDLTIEDPTGNGNPFGDNPTVFGTRWNTDCTFDGRLALGYSMVVVEFINPAGLGASLPNMFDFFDPETNLSLLKLSVRAIAFGRMSDGTRAIAGTRQLWEDLDDTGSVLDNAFSREEVFLRPLGHRR